ncbi:hypothetical protein [Pseudokineococcus sp. 1T1Z-3]|uniref:hypothetical protein n=1 Tax=Pseudokineococcus sp. 1T1Z-3 TaxID=3132745 RepID=UPI0030AAD9C7
MPPSTSGRVTTGAVTDGSPRTLVLGRAARSWRALAASVLAACFVAGSLVGDDHWWPVGPLRMYSTSSSPSGSVRVFVVEVTTASEPGWREVPINLWTLGLNRAELEGRWPLLQSDPGVLATLADAHATLQPEDERWDGVRLVRRSTPMVGGSPDRDATVDTPLVVWTVEDGGQVVGS